MPPLAANTVVSTAVTDLINALVILPMLMHLRRVLPRAEQQGLLWHKLLWQIALCSLLGFVLHIYPWTYVPLAGIWIVLYAILLEGLHSFLSLPLQTFLDGKPSKPVSRLLRAAEFIMLAVLTLCILLHRNPIRLCVLYGVAIAIPAVFFHARLALRGHTGARIFLTAFIPQTPGLVAQIARQNAYSFLGLDFNGFYHVCLLASLILFYFSALHWQPRTK